MDGGKAEKLQVVGELTGLVEQGVSASFGMREFERGLLDRLLAVGCRLIEQFLKEQGDCDCGETCDRDGRTLHRSRSPQARNLRTIFGEHVFGGLSIAFANIRIPPLSPGRWTNTWASDRNDTRRCCRNSQ